VIGVAREARNRWVWRTDDRMIYLPLPPNDPAGHYLLVRTESDSAPVMAQVRSMLPAIDPRLRASAMRIDDNIAFQTAPFRAIAWLSGALGVLALLAMLSWSLWSGFIHGCKPDERDWNPRRSRGKTC
jgi:hypothetical protein